MRVRSIGSRTKIAVSKAQKAVGVVETTLTSRVTSLEMSDQEMIQNQDQIINSINEINTNLITLQKNDDDIAAMIDGFSGDVVIVESVNFTTNTVSTITLNFENGLLKGKI
jgi:hypothetical protein